MRMNIGGKIEKKNKGRRDREVNQERTTLPGGRGVGAGG